MLAHMESAQESYESYRKRNFSWNFFANAGDLTAVNLARSFVFATTVLPLYTSYLTDSAVLIGLIPAILEVGFLLPQVFMAQKAEKLDIMKPFVVKVSIFERVPYLVISLFILFYPAAPNWAAYGILILGIATASGSGGLATPAWKTMLRKVIHPKRKAMVFAIGMGLGGFLGIGGAYLTRRILATVEYPISYGYCFGLAFIGQAVSWLFLTLNREHSKDMATVHQSTGDYFKALPGILRASPNFTRYLIGQTFLIFGVMVASFYIVFARFKLGVDDEYAATLTMAALISQSAGSPLLGWISDKIGHKFMSEACAVFGILSLLLIMVAPTPGWLIVVFILMNLSVAGQKLSRMSITMEFSPVERLPTYTALSGTLMGIPTFLAPIICGWIIEGAGYMTAFIVALVFSVIGFGISRFGVIDPSYRD
jgi:MFS family permease